MLECTLFSEKSWRGEHILATTPVVLCTSHGGCRNKNFEKIFGGSRADNGFCNFGKIPIKLYREMAKNSYFSYLDPVNSIFSLNWVRTFLENVAANILKLFSKCQNDVA